MVKREQYLEWIRPFYDSEMVKVITEIRRCGKSTIMKQIIEEISRNGIADDHILYINFEIYKYRKISNPDAFNDYVVKKFLHMKKKRMYVTWAFSD